MIVCELCTGRHHTSTCPQARRYVIQIVDGTISPTPDKEDLLRRRLMDERRQQTWAEMLEIERARRRRATERKRRQRARLAS